MCKMLHMRELVKAYNGAQKINNYSKLGFKSRKE